METPDVREKIVRSIGFYVAGETIVEGTDDYQADDHHKRLYRLLTELVAALDERQKAFDGAVEDMRRQLTEVNFNTLRAITAGTTGAILAHHGQGYATNEQLVQDAVAIAREVIKQTTPQPEEKKTDA